MGTNRLEYLLKNLKEQPEDPFTLYAIAIEYKSNMPEKSLYYFEYLLAKHPDYLPTYYQLAKLYIDLENNELAKVIYEKGINLAEIQKNMHTLKELQKAYNDFLLDLEFEV